MKYCRVTEGKFSESVLYGKLSVIRIKSMVISSTHIPVLYNIWSYQNVARNCATPYKIIITFRSFGDLKKKCECDKTLFRIFLKIYLPFLSPSSDFILLDVFIEALPNTALQWHFVGSLYNLDLLSSKRRGAYFMVFSDSFASLFSVHGQLISSSDCLIFLM